MKKCENIFKRKDGRWEARYIKGYELSGKIKYGFCYGKTYKEAKEKGLTDIKFYVDDGYTGTNFNRPGFQQLISDIEAQLYEKLYEDNTTGKVICWPRYSLCIFCIFSYPTSSESSL